MDDLEAAFALGAGVAARPHQLGAVRKVCAALHADCHLPRPSNYLVQHAAGSGKSLTIAAMADALTRLEDERSNRFGCIVVISDRKILDDQLSHVVSGYLERVRCDGDGEAPAVIRAESCSHLQQMLGDSGGSSGTRIIVTTFQKVGRATAADEDGTDDEQPPPLPDVAAVPTVADALAADAGGACSEPRIAILADEAHRSHGHGMTATLHRLLCGGKAQPRRVAYVSFSATPSEVALALFGTEDHTSGRREPFSCYPLHEALREQMCVDVLSRYTCKRGDVALYDRLGRSTAIDDVLRATSQTARLRQRAAADEVLVRAKAEGALAFVERALDDAEAGGFEAPKAMIVVRSRRHCALYFAAIQAAIAERSADDDRPPIAVLVAFSGALDGGETERSLNGSRGDAADAFRRAGRAVVIVCAKLETGFDEPRIVCMVIDRTLRGAHAVQVLGRANRAAPHKPAVRVLDYANEAADIGLAFRGFVDASTAPLAEHELQAELGRRMAHISELLLERIGDRSIAAVCASLLGRTDAADALVADLQTYTRDCEALGAEAAGLPYGFCQRLLADVSRDHQPTAGAASAQPTDSGGTLRCTGLQTTFSGAINLAAASAPAALRTRPLTTAVALALSGAAGAEVPLAGAVGRADALVDDEVRAALGGGVTGAAPTEAELTRACRVLSSLTERVVPDARARAVLDALVQRPPPSTEALRSTAVGKLVRRLQSHGHATVAALAKQLYESWRAAADAEAQRRARARALALPASGVDALGADPTRQAAVCLLGEALRTAAREAAAAAADGELAMAIEAAVHRAHGGGTKAYRGRLRLLASVLRAPRAGGLRERLRLGEVGAAAFAAMASFDDVLQSDGDREKKKQRQEKERRAIDSLRIANQGSASSEYKCGSCGSLRCTLYHTNSLGAVHLTSVPDMIVQCLDCEHRFTV